MRRAACLLILTAACGDASVSDDGGPLGEDPLCADNLWYPDRDADGFGDPTRRVRRCDSPGSDWIAVGDDCDDTEPLVFPTADELPNGLDDDCNGVVDNGTAVGDDDGDGYCEHAVACSLPDVLPRDCDDADPVRRPGAVEACNGVDDDCDGAVPDDEGDADEDGARACADCADDDATVYPGAPETCDGRDEDCDGLADDRDGDGDGWTGCAGGGGLVDVLVVVDRAESQAVLRGLLADAAPGWLDALQAADADGSFAVIPADAPAPVGRFHGGEATALTDLVDLPSQRVAVPAALDSAVAFLEGADGRAWRRPGAALAVWILAGSDDRSALALDAALDRFAVVVGRSRSRVSVVAGGVEGCSGFGVRAGPSRRLVELADRSGGSVQLACAASWPAFSGRTWIPAVTRDCDDTQASAFPGAPELCNGADDDCDGRVDEDDDGDGYTVCDGDCDDRIKNRFPGAPERCNGLDDDCDQLVPVAEDDADGDGVRACANDCDDTRDDVVPGATDLCGDGLDADCDGTDGSADDHADGDDDGLSACEGDCDDDDDTVFPLAPEHPWNGVDDDCDGLRDGRDPDVLHALGPLPIAGTVTFAGDRDLFTFCGTAWRSVAVGADGYLVPGGTRVLDATPTVEDLQDHAPFVAVGWEDLDPPRWTAGRFLDDLEGNTGAWLVQRPEGISVLYDHVPYKDGGHLTSITALGLDGSLDLRVLEGNTDDETTVGYACGDRAWTRLDFEEPLQCVQPGGENAASGGLATGEAPVRVTSTCAP